MRIKACRRATSRIRNVAWYTENSMANNDDIPIGGFTTGELKVASFWIRNQRLLRRLLYGSLIGLNVLFWGYAAWGALDAYAISYPRESRITRQVALNQQLLTALGSARPQNVSTSDVSVFQSTDHRYNMVVKVTNPNDKWWVEFNYHFNISGEETPVRSGYVLPQSTQVLTELGYMPKALGGRSATLVVDNVRWHRVDSKFVGVSYKNFAAERFHMTFDNITYDTNIVIGKKRIGQTSFTLDNHTAYGFWKVNLIVQLYRGNSIIAVNQITVKNIQPGEKRPIQMVWMDNLPSVSKTKVIPQVNLLNPSAYLPTQYFK